MIWMRTASTWISKSHWLEKIELCPVEARMTIDICVVVSQEGWLPWRPSGSEGHLRERESSSYADQRGETAYHAFSIDG